jgi:hypothetical protein
MTMDLLHIMNLKLTASEVMSILRRTHIIINIETKEYVENVKLSNKIKED